MLLTHLVIKIYTAILLRHTWFSSSVGICIMHCTNQLMHAYMLMVTRTGWKECTIASNVGAAVHGGIYADDGCWRQWPVCLVWSCVLCYPGTCWHSYPPESVYMPYSWLSCVVWATGSLAGMLLWLQAHASSAFPVRSLACSVSLPFE